MSEPLSISNDPKENESEAPESFEEAKKEFEEAKKALEEITYSTLMHLSADFTRSGSGFIKAEQYESYITPNIYFDDDIKNHTSFELQRKHLKTIEVKELPESKFQKHNRTNIVSYREVCNGYVPYLSARKQLISYIKNDWNTNAYQRLETIIYNFESKYFELLAQEAEMTGDPWSAPDVITKIYNTTKHYYAQDFKLIFLVVFWYELERVLKKKQKYLIKNFKRYDETAEKNEEEEEKEADISTEDLENVVEEQESEESTIDDVIVKDDNAGVFAGWW